MLAVADEHLFGRRSEKVSRDKVLALTFEMRASIRDLIRHPAHIEGGVPHGRPRTDLETMLDFSAFIGFATTISWIRSLA